MQWAIIQPTRREQSELSDAGQGEQEEQKEQGGKRRHILATVNFKVQYSGRWVFIVFWFSKVYEGNVTRGRSRRDLSCPLNFKIH